MIKKAQLDPSIRCIQRCRGAHLVFEACISFLLGGNATICDCVAIHHDCTKPSNHSSGYRSYSILDYFTYLLKVCINLTEHKILKTSFFHKLSNLQQSVTIKNY